MLMIPQWKIKSVTKIPVEDRKTWRGLADDSGNTGVQDKWQTEISNKQNPDFIETEQK